MRRPPRRAAWSSSTRPGGWSISCAGTRADRRRRVAAHRAHAARLGLLALGAQERARQEARRRRLADAARPREEIGVRHAAGRQRVPERPGDRVLPDDRVEYLRPPLSRQDLVAHILLTRRCKVTVHPPLNDPYRDLPRKPAPVRYSHGTREGRLTVAPFRAWRGSTILVAWGPAFNAAPGGSFDTSRPREGVRPR